MKSFIKRTLLCPLCDSAESSVRDKLTANQIKALWAALGYQFSRSAWGDITDETEITLNECLACGFRFFDSSLAGGESFYREVEYDGYYAPIRPEFERVLTFAGDAGSKRVLDVGCGAGAFLDLAKKRGMATCGVELNSSAATKAREKGHVIFEQLLHNLGAESGKFDLITFFQVLEHVPSPVNLLKDAVSLLQPGGIVAMAVPSDHGLLRMVPYDPHQWPPHHLSRWRREDAGTLGRKAGLEAVEIGSDMLVGREIEQVMKLREITRSALEGRPPKPASLLPKALSILYRKAGLKFVFPRWGHSLYAFYRKSH